MAICKRCGGDSLAYRRKNQPLGKDMELYWLCNTCFTGLPAMSAVKRHGLAFYRRVAYQVVIPVMAVVFTLIELGLHL